MAPCLRIGSYVELTRCPSNITDRAPRCESPPREVHRCGSPLAIAVTNRHVMLGRLGQPFEPSWFTQPTRLFSWSVMIHGPWPLPLNQGVALPKYAVSMVPLS